MQYVTYEMLYALLGLIVSIIGLCYAIFKHKK